MRNNSLFTWVVLGAVSSALAGCGASREVEVAGEVSAPADVRTEGAILVELADVLEASEAPTSVHTATLNAPGKFTEKVELEGDKVRIRAINDRDNNGKCSAGEPWGQVEAAILDDDTVAPVTLTLTHAACPSAE
jgi:hypothetical protein